MGRIYSWYVSGGTVKIKIHEQGDSMSVTHTGDFIMHFRKQFATSFFSCYVEFLLVLFGVSITVQFEAVSTTISHEYFRPLLRF